jgi:hypothetical protein
LISDTAISYTAAFGSNNHPHAEAFSVGGRAKSPKRSLTIEATYDLQRY